MAASATEEAMKKTRFTEEQMVHDLGTLRPEGDLAKNGKRTRAPGAGRVCTIALLVGPPRVPS